MGSVDKENLIKKLIDGYDAIYALIDSVDLTQPVHPDSGWQIKDILGHIATWDLEIAKSLQGFLAGSVYLTPDLDEEEIDFNQREVDRKRSLSSKQILADWEQAREEFKDAIKAIPDDRFPGELMYPWGDEIGSIAVLVGYFIEHDEEHFKEIKNFLGYSNEG